MKTLYVARHAKSSWDNPKLDDFDRPLNNRGKKDAPLMGEMLKKRNCMPDIIITSPAKRAKKTANKIAGKLNFNKHLILKDKRLYHAGVNVIASVISEVDEAYDKLMIFGHNPGFTDFVNHISDAGLDNIPTCGVVIIKFDIDSWQDISSTKGAIEAFEYPKKFK